MKVKNIALVGASAITIGNINLSTSVTLEEISSHFNPSLKSLIEQKNRNYHIRTSYRCTSYGTVYKDALCTQ